MTPTHRRYLLLFVCIAATVSQFSCANPAAPPEATVPPYTNMPRALADVALRAAGLKMVVDREVPAGKHPPDTVLSGNVPAGRVVRTGRTVAVTITRAPAAGVNP